MRLDKWAHVAEIVGGIAIVTSLIVLIFEVRANTELARVAAYDAVSRDFDRFRTSALSNPEWFELFYRWNLGDVPDPVSEPEAAFKLNMLLLNDFGGHERAYLAYKAGIVGDDEWTRLHRSECAQWALVSGSYLRENLRFRLTDDYVANLEDDCE